MKNVDSVHSFIHFKLGIQCVILIFPVCVIDSCLYF